MPREWMYNKNWTDRYASISDVEITVEGVQLPAHSSVLSQSDLFCKMFLNPKNHHDSVSKTFEGRSVEDIDLLLAHVYVTREILKPQISQKLVNLANDFQFMELRDRVLDYVTKNVEAKIFLEGKLNSLDHSVVDDWVSIANLTDHFELRKIIGVFIANKYGVIFKRKESEWRWLANKIESDAYIWRTISQTLFDRFGR
ncbi:hypothetical protein BSKO_13436 [Bryopsis sp. KO-2023]|nr:hypothetical protein BSKO_13436 [Bryopsis sp. KO-2023]